MLPQESTGALAGVTVLELGARIGVSVAGSLLAQLGASVVFVEAVTGGGFAQPKWQFRDQYAAGTTFYQLYFCSTYPVSY